MECNKDEAIRAKGIAEDRMRNNDFEGARKFALKAQNLHPEVDNISQMLSICDVHCSAQQSLVGAEKDWYGILQVQRLANDESIRKQYRRLALILHPDKNRFPGAEAAFKLISEANAVLSDAMKKSLYDTKVRVSTNSAAYQAKRNVQLNSQSAAQRNFTNGHSNLNHHQAKGSSSSIKEDVFWTSCPYCNIQYQYHRQFVNRYLRCPTCMKPYMACEITSRGVSGTKSRVQASSVPSRPGQTNSFGFQPKAEPIHGPSKVNMQDDKGFYPPHGVSARPGSSNPPDFQQKKEPIHRPPKVNGQDDKGFSTPHAGQQGIPAKKAQTDFMHGIKGGIPSNDAIDRESGNMISKISKRGRKQVVESSESFDASIDTDLDDVTNQQTSGNLPTGSVTRRSKRSKQDISYNESDDDPTTSPKRSKISKSSDDCVMDQKEVPNGEFLKNENEHGVPVDATNSGLECKGARGEGAVIRKEKLQYKDTKCDTEAKVNHVEKSDPAGSMSFTGVEKVDIKNKPDLNTEDSKKDSVVLPDAEFHDFEKGRDATLFKVDRYWALYDPSDGMPRFYAKVRKASVSPFEVSITWLEATPINKSFEIWVKNMLPVGCGTFKFGNTEKISEVSMFSHEVKEVQIQKLAQGRKRGSLNVIYPRKGEIWVLLKDWDTNWSLDPEKHRKFKYEIVEVLSDFDQGTGIRVGYLDKVEGFVSLFQRTVQNDADSFLIGPDQLYKFSHCVPSFELTGSERKGVPKGSFELDPASLPLDPDDLHFPVKAKTVSRATNADVHPKSAKKGAKSAGPAPETPSTPKGFAGVDPTSALRRSSRGSNSLKKNAN